MPAEQRPSPDAQAAAITAALAGAATTAAVGGTGAALAGYWTANAAVLAALTKLYVRWGYRREATRWVLRAVVELAPRPGALSPAPGPARAATGRAGRTFAAWFLQRSADRIERRLAAGMSPDDAVGPERRYLEQHLTAQKRRAAAADRVDELARKAGNVTVTRDAGPGRIVLTWRAHPDDKVTPECRAADGAWFYADTPPVIGYPGMPHGGTCRCWPVKATALDVARGRTVDEAVRGIIATEPDHRDHPGSAEDDERESA